MTQFYKPFAFLTNILGVLLYARLGKPTNHVFISELSSVLQTHVSNYLPEILHLEQ